MDRTCGVLQVVGLGTPEVLMGSTDTIGVLLISDYEPVARRILETMQLLPCISCRGGVGIDCQTHHSVVTLVNLPHLTVIQARNKVEETPELVLIDGQTPKDSESTGIRVLVLVS